VLENGNGHSERATAGLNGYKLRSYRLGWGCQFAGTILSTAHPSTFIPIYLWTNYILSYSSLQDGITFASHNGSCIPIHIKSRNILAAGGRQVEFGVFWRPHIANALFPLSNTFCIRAAYFQ